MFRERARRVILAPGSENVEKIKKVVEDGNYYGAQQMYKTFSARYISSERYSEALDILESGACIQLENGQVTCGMELALLFVETLIKGKIPYDDNTLDRIRKVYKKFPRIPMPQHLDLGDDDDMQRLSEALGAAKTRAEGCSSFLKAAIKWSIELGAQKNGSPEIHDMLADYIYSESPELDMAKVSYHFVRGKNPKNFASTLVNFMGKCYPGEDDLAVARAVFMYLAMGNLRDANILMDEMKRKVQFQDVDFPQSELMELVNYLLKTLQRDALPFFNMLRQRYELSINREPIFNELLDEVAAIFYGVQQRNPMPGMFGEFFKAGKWALTDEGGGLVTGGASRRWRAGDRRSAATGGSDFAGCDGGGGGRSNGAVVVVVDDRSVAESGESGTVVRWSLGFRKDENREMRKIGLGSMFNRATPTKGTGRCFILLSPTRALWSLR